MTRARISVLVMALGVGFFASLSSPAEAYTFQQRTGDPCSGGSGRSNARSGLGGVLGTIAGDWVGSQLGSSGLSQNARRQARNLVSNSVACALSPREREQSDEAELSALNSGSTGTGSQRRWTSQERPGVGGVTEVIERGSLGGTQCAITRVMMTDDTGAEIAVRKRRCQGADGGWSEGEIVA